MNDCISKPNHPQSIMQLPPAALAAVQARPRAVITVVQAHDGQVGVQAQCPPDAVLIQGLLAEAGRQILKKLDEAARGPQITPASASLLAN